MINEDEVQIIRLKRKEIKKLNNGYTRGMKWFHLQYLPTGEIIGRRWIDKLEKKYDTGILIEIFPDWIKQGYGKYLLEELLPYHKYTYCPTDAAIALYKSIGLELIQINGTISEWRHIE